MQSSNKMVRRLQLESLESRALLATLVVTSGADDGPGTLRSAIDAANSNGQVNTIVLRNVGTISLESSLNYTSGRNLDLLGGNAAIQPAAGSEGEFDLLVSSGGANLRISNLTVRDGANGIFVPVPSDRTGTVAVSLSRVNLTDNGAFGLHIDDQAGLPGLGADSATSIDLTLSQSSATGNGFAALDLDGVRVDEGGEGNIVARVINSSIDGNGADGLELDERGNGSATLIAVNSSFDGNGSFDLVVDPDDGIDLDEAGAGGINVSIVNSSINGNFDEGLDMSETDEGNLTVSLTRVQANGNSDEGIKGDETLGGDVVLSFVHVEASDTLAEEGISFEETGDGSLIAFLAHVIASGNDKEGIELVEEDAGSVTARLTHVTANGNGNDGVQITEAGAGDLRVSAIRLRATGNDGFGLVVEQEDEADDVGSLLLIGAKLSPNVDGELETAGVVTTRL